MIDIPIWVWIAFNGFILALLAFDLGLLNKTPHEIKAREALWQSAGYIGLALIFNAVLYYWQGEDAALKFLTGFLVEKSLSLDNIFVIAMIFGQFAVPAKYQHRVLFWGVLGALVMRAALIFAGTALVEEFSFLLYIFGAILIYTGITMLREVDKHPDMRNHWVLRFARRFYPVTETYHEQRFFVRQNAVLMMTPLFLVLLLIEATDLLFALDSIPAIFAITTDPFLVYTSNVFAILGLRALYFALAALLPRFKYLKHGLSALLIVIGAKLIAIDFWHPPTTLTLGVTVGILGTAVIVSLIASRQQPAAPVRDPSLGAGQS